MKKLNLVLLFILAVLAGKTQIISGVVKDSITHEPLVGASVYVVEVQKGGFTDENGEFSVEVGSINTFRIAVSYLGYESKTRKLDVKSMWQAGFREFRLQPVSVKQKEVVVTGTRMETDKGSVPLTTSVLTSSDLEKSAEINVLPLVSQKVPGVFVTQRGFTGFGIADGSAGKISIRGIGSNDQSRVLVLIDGQPQVMGIFGHAFADMYNTSDYNKVEIIRGPASLIYGSNAMGGVINLITPKKEDDGFSLDAIAQYGSFNTMRGTLKAGYKKDKLSLWATGNYDRTDGHRPHSEFKSQSGHVGLSYQINQHFNARLTGNATKFYAVDPGPESLSIAYDTLIHDATVFRVNSMFSLSNKFDKASGNVNVFYNRGNHEVYTNWTSIDRNWGITAFEEFQFRNDLKLSVGADYNQYGGQGSGMVPADSVDYIGVTEAGVYTFMQKKFADKVNVNAGVRYAYHSLYGSQLIPQLGVNYNITDQHEVKALISKGYRSPNVKELYFFPISNDSLQPESMWNYELGYTIHLLENKLSATFTAFYIEGENLIQLMPTGKIPPMKNQNSGSFKHKGVEFEATYRLKSNLVLDANYAYLNMDTPKIASPKHMAQAGFSYILKHFDLSGSLQYVNGLYTNVATIKTQNYLLANAKANYRISQHWSIFVSGNNLLNTKYEIMDGYAMPGVSFMTGAKFRLKY